MSTIFDDEAQAEMLCYLVVGELVAIARTGDWLRTDHLVELSLVCSSGCAPTVQIRNGETASASSAWRPTWHPTSLATFGLRTEKTRALLFTDGGRLDYRVPLVGQIHDQCAARLQRA